MELRAGTQRRDVHFAGDTKSDELSFSCFPYFARPVADPELAEGSIVEGCFRDKGLSFVIGFDLTFGF